MPSVLPPSGDKNLVPTWVLPFMFYAKDLDHFKMELSGRGKKMLMDVVNAKRSCYNQNS